MYPARQLYLAALLFKIFDTRLLVGFSRFNRMRRRGLHLLRLVFTWSAETSSDWFRQIFLALLQCRLLKARHPMRRRFYLFWPLSIDGRRHTPVK